VSVVQKISAALLGLLLTAAGVAWWLTAPPSPKTVAKRSAAVTSMALVDESTYATAERLAALATTPVEQAFAQSTLRIADHELALAFTAALRDAEAHPPTLTPRALTIQDRLQKSQGLLDNDQQRVAQLTAQLAASKPTQQDALQDELDLAKSQLDLDQDEVEEANEDLVAAGGNPQLRIEALIQDHDAQVKSRTTAAMSAGSAAASVPQHGALFEFREWLAVRQKLQQLVSARDAAARKADASSAQREALAQSLDNSKGSIAALAHHTKNAKAGADGSAAALGSVAAPGIAAGAGLAVVPPAAVAGSAARKATVAGTAPAAGPAAPHTHADAAALLNQTKQITADQKVLTVLDRQSADQRQLAGVYQQWNDAISLQASALVHQLLLDAAVIIAILLLVIFLDRWAQHLLNNPKLDRRQVETLRSLARISLRVLALFVIVLILIGLPSQFGTMIGIVGAGLTVALKDFIVAFFGWLVLMGRNGIRLGDWVEINGVSGEVTELGMFHTVLLETGNWSDAGHPTGRRVTFTNSFAIEGHYFNFSTSGQWLWDELQVIVPAGQDLYPIVDAITKQVVEATADSARQAEQEWQRAVPTQRGKTFSGTPGVNVKPVVGGVEIAVRYITRAHERFQLRAKLYQAAVDLLGHKSGALPPSAS
jgi:small-conductance mechanosensitive channel